MNYSIRKKRHLIIKFALLPFLSLSLYFSVCFAMEVPIYNFPINSYSQNANDYLSADGEDYSKALLSNEYQQLQFQQFYNHYFASDPQGLSPWSRQMVRSTLALIK